MATMTLEQLVSQLSAAYGSALRSVVLYGSAARGEHSKQRSDYNVLVIVDALGLEPLRAAAAATSAWREAGNGPPLTMTTREWRGSADIFPMEYADIIERHKVLFGESPFEGITVSPDDLRLQLEQEAMGKLLRLRQGVLASANDGKRQVELLAASKSAVMIVFRALLRLHGRVAPTDDVALSSEVAKLGGWSAAPFERVVRHVRGERAIAPAEAGEVLAEYLAGMEALVAYLDRFTRAT